MDKEPATRYRETRICLLAVLLDCGMISVPVCGFLPLTQAMGGGKTHVMIALGLLAGNAALRKKVLGDDGPGSNLGAVRVVGFTGRESDAKLGIWGEIADQLGKKEFFKDYYSPLQAPGETAWINLLKGEPTIILLDELPPYMDYVKSKQIGNSALSVVTTTALSNLLVAVNKAELTNVCVVISDLTASYQDGAQQINQALSNLQNETNRSALRIEPVNPLGDELYHILRTRLFENLPGKETIKEVANEYAKAVRDAKEMDVTSASPDSYAAQLIESYPFHFSIRDLYGRFKENPGFQQTRGLIRMMRIIVSRMYESGKASEVKLIHPSAKDAYCYQKIEILPGLDEVDVEAEKVTLIVTEPTTTPSGKSRLSPEWDKFADDIEYKNRVIFLTGSHDTLTRVVEQAAQYRAIQPILADFDTERLPDNDPQRQRALVSSDKIILSLRSAIQETFTTLAYPSKDGFRSTDCRIQFHDNQFDGETLIRDTLEKLQKFTNDISSDTFRKKCEARLFGGQQKALWSEIKRRAATQTTWQFHRSDGLENLKKTAIHQEMWRDEGGYIDKGPFPPPKTAVKIQRVSRDDKTGEATLKITPVHGDTVYYEIGDTDPTPASNRVEAFNGFKTKESSGFWVFPGTERTLLFGHCTCFQGQGSRSSDFGAFRLA